VTGGEGVCGELLLEKLGRFGRYVCPDENSVGGTTNKRKEDVIVQNGFSLFLGVA